MLVVPTCHYTNTTWPTICGQSIRLTAPNTLLQQGSGDRYPLVPCRPADLARGDAALPAVKQIGGYRLTSA